MNVVLILLLAVMLAAAVFISFTRMKRGGGCCGSHDAPEKRVRGKQDRYTRTLVWRIGGLTCENCARRLQNRLNGLPGVSARVSLSDRKAFIRCTDSVDPHEVKDTIIAAGFTAPDAP